MNTIRPNVTHGIVSRLTGNLFTYQGWPTVTKDENGVLYAVSSAFRLWHVCPFGKTALYISKDDGKTWSMPTVINDTYLDDRDAGICYLGNGKMLVSWFTHAAKDYQNHWQDYMLAHTPSEEQALIAAMLSGYDRIPTDAQQGGSYVRLSEDYGKTWGEIIRIPVTAPHGATLCKDGSLIYLGTEHYSEGKLLPKHNYLYRSNDLGRTWVKESSIENPDWLTGDQYLTEPYIIELPNGDLYAAFRVERVYPFSIATAVSKDGGKTWSEVHPTGVSGSPPHLLLHSSGALVCSFARRQEPYSIRAMISYDFGQSWSEEYILDERSTDSDIGYPSTVELSDGSLMTVYYQRYENDTKCSVLYTRWELNT